MSVNSIRPYSLLDLDKVISIFRGNTPKFFSTEEEIELKHYLKEEIEDYFVFEQDGVIVGCGGINYDNNFTIGVISWDIIDINHHGMGIGGTLLKHRLSILKNKKEIKKIIVRTSQIVFSFYEKAGFKLKKTQKDYWAEGFDLYHMEIEL